jgi:uncharacterized protein (TIGR00645 family)
MSVSPVGWARRAMVDRRSYGPLTTLIRSDRRRGAPRHGEGQGHVKSRFYTDPVSSSVVENIMSGKPAQGIGLRARRPGLRPLPRLIFMSRWLQLPLYVGLILAQGVYVFHFWVDLSHLVQAAFNDQNALLKVFTAVGATEDLGNTMHLTETSIMLVVLGLIDVVMISNLLIMVIIGGYETFVSRLDLNSHPDSPEWLDHVNASVLKVKLATAIIGISSIHLLKTFINAEALSPKTMIAQTAIHLSFLASAMAIACADRLTLTITRQKVVGDPGR